MKTKFKTILIVIFVLSFCSLATTVMAVDVGTEPVQSTIALGSEDPRAMAARIIQIGLGFLGIIAVGLVIYGGFLWMTSNGDADQVDKAKKLLASAVIGLAIILSAFAIASFVLKQLLEATGVGSGGSGGGGGDGSSGSYTGSVSSFVMRSSSPNDDSEDVARNVKIRAFFNKDLDPAVSLDNNFKVTQTATQVDSGSPVSVSNEIVGQIELVGAREAVFTASDTYVCGTETTIGNCLPEWSTYEVSVNGASGIVTPTGQSLNCGSRPCVFDFSTGDLVDTEAPTANIDTKQMCKSAGLNTLSGWGRDDIGVKEIAFYSQVGSEVAQELERISYFDDQVSRRQEAETEIDAANFTIGETYKFGIKVFDLANSQAEDSFEAVIRAEHCCNGVKDMDETDIDCGGSDCLSCVGAACNKTEPNTCAADNDNCDDSKCSTDFCNCTGTGCFCDAKPVIEWVSPEGGFCDGSKNTSCASDDDCSAFTPATCNLDTANLSGGNMVSVGGKNFGAYVSGVSKIEFNDGTGWKAGRNPKDANSSCNNGWSDDLILTWLPDNLTVTDMANVRITAGNNLVDEANDDWGPEVEVIINSIERPGLCQISPQSGAKGDTFNLFGINLGGKAYFGSYRSGIEAVSSSLSETSGTAKVPALQSGRTSIFVSKAGVNSNYQKFVVDRLPEEILSITYFSPVRGNKSQYLTIYGSGFGASKGSSRVMIGGVEKNEMYEFPDICTGNVWSNNMITVKIPDGLSDKTNNAIKVMVGNDVANSEEDVIPTGSGVSKTFYYDESLSVAPGFCRISPAIGPVQTEVYAFGENFGAESKGAVLFAGNKFATVSDWRENYLIKNIFGFERYEDKVDYIKMSVPAGALTGPVNVSKKGVACSPSCGDGYECVGGTCYLKSNSLNYTVGSCLASEKPEEVCGGGYYCCPQNSPEAGRCVSGVDSGACYKEAKNSVFSWDFYTSGQKIGEFCYPDYSGGSCDINNSQCVADAVCNPNSCRCEPEVVSTESCQLRSMETGICDNIGCPNKPGSCLGGSLDPINCECAADEGYAADLDKCYKKNTNDPLKCFIDNNENLVIAGVSIDLKDLDAVCRHSITENKNIIQTKGITCPSSWVRLGLDSGWCALVVGNNLVECETCSSNLSCATTTAVTLAMNEGICVNKNELCLGAASCDIDNKECIGGNTDVCECCCEKDEEARDCCSFTYNGEVKQLQCAGSCGNSSSYGTCSGCRIDANNDGSINAEEQIMSDSACNCSTTSGNFCDVNADVDGDGIPEGACRDCSDLIGNPTECSSHSTCCVDAEKNNVCRGGEGDKSLDVFNNLSYCKYFECSATGGSCTGDAVASSTGKVFKTNEECESECIATVGGTGVSGYCRSGSSCDYTFCSDPFNCLDKNGVDCEAGNGEDCGVCCCDPDAATDECQLAGLGALSCQADQSPCSGNERGLCCGCYMDDQCAASGDPVGAGCGNDTCCHARPSVTEQAPQDNGCQNAVITATFDQVMNQSSFKNNVYLLGEYAGNCPANTVYLTINTEEEDAGIITKLGRGIKGLYISAKNYIFGDDTAQAVDPDPNMNYCVIKGTAGGYAINNGTQTVMEFYPSKKLDAARNYFVVVAGDADLNSVNGVKSIYGVGMNGTGLSLNESIKFNNLSFPNSHIWYFKTYTDEEDARLCPIDKIRVEPENYLFQSNTDSLNEVDVEDTEKDDDKKYTASVLAKNGQKLNPINLAWAWDLSPDTFADIVDITDNPHQVLVDIKDGVIDAKFEVSATAGDRQGVTDARVFVCQNPWPLINADGSWLPLDDPEYNYEMYFCRDAGADGTLDDLPTLVEIPDVPGAGDILKEKYLIANEISNPSSPVKFDVNQTVTGKALQLVWSKITGVGDLAGYKLYWDNNSKFIEIDKGDGTVDRVVNYDASLVSCGLEDGDIACVVSGLLNSTTYNFTLSYYNAAGTEEEIGTLTKTPADVTAPDVPTINSLSIADNKATIKWNSQKGVSATDDAVNYRVYYKAGVSSADCGSGLNFGYAGNSVPNNKAVDELSLSVSNLRNCEQYCFGINAFDISGNESAKVVEHESVQPTKPEITTISASDTGATVNWNAVSALDSCFGKVKYNLYYEIVSAGTDCAAIAKAEYDDKVEAIDPAGRSTVSRNVTGLTNCEHYCFGVEAIDSLGKTSAMSYGRVVVESTDCQ